MNNQLRAAELLRQAAAALSQRETSGDQPEAHPTPQCTTAHSIQAAVRNTFSPYTRNARAGNSSRAKITAAATFWTHKFCLLASTTQDTAPTREEKQKLFEGGLGEKRITFPKNDNPANFKQILEQNFPGLETCGGYELMRSTVGSRVYLEKLRMPSNGFTTNYLSNESNLGQACCFIRPIQRDIQVKKLDDKHDGEMVFEECMECKSSIPLSSLRDHIRTCVKSLPSDEEEDESSLPKLKKRKKQTPVCQFMCDADRNRQV